MACSSSIEILSLKAGSEWGFDEVADDDHFTLLTPQPPRGPSGRWARQGRRPRFHRASWPALAVGNSQTAYFKTGPKARRLSDPMRGLFFWLRQVELRLGEPEPVIRVSLALGKLVTGELPSHDRIASDDALSTLIIRDGL